MASLISVLYDTFFLQESFDPGAIVFVKVVLRRRTSIDLVSLTELLN